jgi:peptidoglycan-N-acetylglucosamine deacetylase
MWAMRMLPMIAAGTAAAAWTAPALAPVAAPVARALGVPRRLPDGATGVAVTFDDGPHPRGTPAVLESLARHGVPATFFLVGEQIERDPGLAAEIVAAGHAVAVHGFHHRCQLRLTPRQLADDLDRGADAVARATGVAPALYRPPYGIFAPHGLCAVRARGWAPLLWSRWGRDWRRFTTAERIARKVGEDFAPGDVVLLHDADDYSARNSYERTVAALPRILDAIAARGLPAVRVA